MIMKEIIPIIIYLWATLNILFIIYLVNCPDSNLSIFNPIRNYNEWTQFNWIGITIITLLLNVTFILYAVVYWIYKLFTVGRKEK